MSTNEESIEYFERERDLRIETLALAVKEQKWAAEWNRGAPARQAESDAREERRLAALEGQVAAHRQLANDASRQTVAMERIAAALEKLAPDPTRPVYWAVPITGGVNT